jgi:hypothetical protein
MKIIFLSFLFSRRVYAEMINVYSDSFSVILVRDLETGQLEEYITTMARF